VREKYSNLLKQLPFLDGVGDRLLLDALLFVYVLECIELFGSFVFNDANLSGIH
jgi:hypothetical protein